MTPEQAIAQLDRQLAAHGQDVTLIRYSGTSTTVLDQAACRGFVRQKAPEQLAGNLIQVDADIVLSPTDLTAAGWPDDPKKGDKVEIDGDATGRQRTVLWAEPIRLAGTLVRVNLHVRG